MPASGDIVARRQAEQRSKRALCLSDARSRRHRHTRRRPRSPWRARDRVARALDTHGRRRPFVRLVGPAAAARTIAALGRHRRRGEEFDMLAARPAARARWPAIDARRFHRVDEEPVRPCVVRPDTTPQFVGVCGHEAIVSNERNAGYPQCNSEVERARRAGSIHAR